MLQKLFSQVVSPRLQPSYKGLTLAGRAVVGFDQDPALWLRAGCPSPYVDVEAFTAWVNQHPVWVQEHL